MIHTDGRPTIANNAGDNLKDVLRHHVSGAVERGEAEPIFEVAANAILEGEKLAEEIPALVRQPHNVEITFTVLGTFLSAEMWAKHVRRALAATSACYFALEEVESVKARVV